MSDLVGNPEDRFSHNEAHVSVAAVCSVCTRNTLVVNLGTIEMRRKKIDCQLKTLCSITEFAKFG